MLTRSKASRYRIFMAPVATAIGIVMTLAILSPSPLRAEFQNEQIGFSPNHVFEGVIQGENVDIMTGNVNLSIPLGPRYQLNDWFGYQITMYYNSRVWKHDCSYVNPSDPCNGTFIGSDTYGLGFTISFGRIYRDSNDVEGVWRYQTPSGGEHFFCSDDASANDECNDMTDFTFDESTIRVEFGPNPNLDPGQPANIWSAWPGDGTIIRFANQVPSDGWYATRIETVERDDSGQGPRHFVDINYGSGSDAIGSRGCSSSHPACEQARCDQVSRTPDE